MTLVKTMLDQNDHKHRLLIALMAKFVEEGYTPHELFMLMDHSKGQMFHALSQIHKESKEG